MATKKNTTQEVEHDEAKVDAKAGGAMAGGVTGAAIGAAVGGPVGAGIGAVVGAAAGGLTGSALDYNEVEPEFRSHYESGPYKAINTWDEVGPAYRHGFDSASREEYRDRSWDDVRADLKKSWRSKGHFDDVESLVRHGWERRAQARLDAGGTTTIPVVEEEMKVGKRKVEKGGVRVETHVTETPVEQQVRLHEEHVEVERRPVSRKATAADQAAALKEGTLELRETAEEVVIAKTQRVVEEVVIRKQGRDRTQTVRDTVRKTDVEVHEDAGTERVVSTGWTTLEAGFRKDAEKRYKKAGYTYDQVAPAYRFGHDLAADERYRADWGSVEPEARTMWEERNKGSWDQFKDSVQHAWTSATGRKS